MGERRAFSVKMNGHFPREVFIIYDGYSGSVITPKAEGKKQ